MKYSYWAGETTQVGEVMFRLGYFEDVAPVPRAGEVHPTFIKGQGRNVLLVSCYGPGAKTERLVPDA